jgi:hypothetical protein
MEGGIGSSCRENNIFSAVFSQFSGVQISNNTSIARFCCGYLPSEKDLKPFWKMNEGNQ